ncbi:PaaI family thioesterase [Celeribacter halophilus]|uniref:PaaI family thioesterase n=1 Tax=Celeribacter halophilus TaxID=576117 RepID=UPI001C09B98E|nr:PaaI family thioesterase [Celeribacter halophilus]MBU2891385.1 PaaI family thioesterase [Celeribacter halophilus]MDO6512401.1 PaaI family thioesterase [Celeribacter halophilus]
MSLSPDFHPFRQDDALMNAIGVAERAETEAGVVLRIVANRIAANPLGIMHGGMLSTISDVGMYEAAKLSCFADCVTLAQEMKFLRAGCLETPIDVVCTVVKPGRSIAFTAAELWQSGKLIATSTGQYLKLPTSAS